MAHVTPGHRGGAGRRQPGVGALRSRLPSSWRSASGNLQVVSVATRRVEGRAGDIRGRRPRHPLGYTHRFPDTEVGSCSPADDLLVGDGLRPVTERLEGVYAVARFGHDGSGVLVNDAVRTAPALLRSVWGHERRLQPRPSVRGDGARRSPDPSPWSTKTSRLWVLLNGQFFGEATGYRDIRLVPFGAAVEIETRTGIPSRALAPDPDAGERRTGIRQHSTGWTEARAA